MRHLPYQQPCLSVALVEVLVIDHAEKPTGN